MKTPEAIGIARRLVAVSDVVAENFSGRVMPSWGLDYPILRELQPSIIMLSHVRVRSHRSLEGAS